MTITIEQVTLIFISVNRHERVHTSRVTNFRLRITGNRLLVLNSQKSMPITLKNITFVLYQKKDLENNYIYAKKNNINSKFTLAGL